jgi:predicted RNA-binding protein with PUA-like domain
MNYWLMKSEPDVFGVEHFKARPRRTASWDGVRNFQARNFMRAMKRGASTTMRGARRKGRCGSWWM